MSLPLALSSRLFCLFFACAVALAGCAPAPSDPATDPMGDPATDPAPAGSSLLADVDTRALAAKLVDSSAVKEHDIVLITGGVQDWTLLEDVAVEVRKRGAWPVTTPLSEDLTRRLVDEVPARFDTQAPRRDLQLAGIADVTISIEFIQSDLLLAHVEPARVAAQAAAFRPVTDRLFERGVRQVALGNGLLPTPAAANRWGVSQEELARIYWAGVNTDYDALQARAAEVADRLTTGETVRITDANGTDLMIGIAGQTAVASDGVISEEDLARGGGALAVYLPAGEAFVAPVPGTATGRVVVDRMFFQGRPIENLELTFEAGRLVSMTAASGLAPMQALYEASDDQKSMLSAIDIGLNPDVTIPAGSGLRTWVSAGMVTIGLGNNLWASGTNSSSFFLPIHLPGATLEVDGAPIVRAGQLVR
jgi:leucyl aminopeptidase (aminopeptidase T)